MIFKDDANLGKLIYSVHKRSNGKIHMDFIVLRNLFDTFQFLKALWA